MVTAATDRHVDAGRVYDALQAVDRACDDLSIAAFEVFNGARGDARALDASVLLHGLTWLLRERRQEIAEAFGLLEWQPCRNRVSASGRVRAGVCATECDVCGGASSFAVIRDPRQAVAK